VTVTTAEPLGVSIARLVMSEQEHYRDASGNDLTVGHNNNGVQLYFNGIIIQFYNTGQWTGGA